MATSRNVSQILNISSSDDEIFLDAYEPFASSSTVSCSSSSFDEQSSTDRLFTDVDAVNLALRRIDPHVHVNPNLIFEQLEIFENDGNRVNIVVNLLSSGNGGHAGGQRTEVPRQGSESTFQQHHEMPYAALPPPPPLRQVDTSDGHQTLQDVDVIVDHELMDDVIRVLDALPTANPEKVYTHLVSNKHEPNRVKLVVEQIIHDHAVGSPLGPTSLEWIEGAIGVPKREPSSTDLNAQATVKRQRTVENSADRKQVTSSQELKMNVETAEVEEDAKPSTSTDLKAVEVNDDSLTEEQIKDKQLDLQGMFPDADPDHLRDLAIAYGDEEKELEMVVAKMIEDRQYPKMKDRLEEEKIKELKLKYSTRTFTVDEVLQWFEDPIKLFYDTSRQVSATYETHTFTQLCNDFPKFVLTDIRRALYENKRCYAPTLRALQLKKEEDCKTMTYKRRRPRKPMLLPDIPDEIFYKELAFTKIEEQLRERLESKARLQKEKFEEAKTSGRLVTCLCCFDDENLLEDMIDCGASHVFCRECVRRGVEVAIGQGKCELSCMSGTCNSFFSLNSLQQALSPKAFSNLLRKIQVEEITRADIPDLVQCPYCSFAAIMPNHEDKIFRCLNADCLKETCRLCKEPNHVPLRCEEVEKSAEVKMRTYIENRMTEALVRECYSCKRRFMKSQGCNKMTCVCGAHMCYMCRQPIKDYSHFTNGQCPQNVDTALLHQTELTDGAEKARKDFLEQHPEMKDIHLKHDPTSQLPKSRTTSDAEWKEVFEGDDYYSDVSSEYDSDDDSFEDSLHLVQQEDSDTSETEPESDDDDDGEDYWQADADLQDMTAEETSVSSNEVMVAERAQGQEPLPVWRNDDDEDEDQFWPSCDVEDVQQDTYSDLDDDMQQDRYSDLDGDVQQDRHSDLEDVQEEDRHSDLEDVQEEDRHSDLEDVQEEDKYSDYDEHVHEYRYSDLEDDVQIDRYSDLQEDVQEEDKNSYFDDGDDDVQEDRYSDYEDLQEEDRYSPDSMDL